jgi:hypothetical protein
LERVVHHGRRRGQPARAEARLQIGELPPGPGHGQMPCTFAGLERQGFRWCFGNIQILRKHWEALMPWAHWIDPENRLTQAQRYFWNAFGNDQETRGWYTVIRI